MDIRLQRSVVSRSDLIGARIFSKDSRGQEHQFCHSEVLQLATIAVFAVIDPAYPVVAGGIYLDMVADCPVLSMTSF